MPKIEILNGIKINIYANEHPPPHFHAIYGEYEAMIKIANLDILNSPIAYKQIQKS